MAEFEGPRGFRGYARVETTYGDTVEVQQSSAASAPHCWLRIRGEDPETRTSHSLMAHMNVEQATEVRDALTAWIDDAEAGRA